MNYAGRTHLLRRPGKIKDGLALRVDRREEIRSKVDIESLLYEMGAENIVRYRPNEIRCGCPIHKGVDPNFSFDLDKGIWTCFSHGCGEDLKSRDVFSLVQAVMGWSFTDAFIYLATRTGVDISGEGYYDKELSDSIRVSQWIKSRQRLIFRRELTPISEEILAKFRGNHNSYLYQRGFSQEVIDRFEIGYATEGEMAGRIIIPIRDEEGVLVGFSGRLATDDETMIKKYGKYKHMANFNRGMVLFGLDKAKEAVLAHDTIILTEGFFDVMRAHEYGAPQTVAVMGSLLVNDQMRLILKYCTNVVICMDNDTNGAGQRATLKIIDKLHNFCKVRVMMLPDGKDIDQCSIEEFWNAYDNLLTPLEYKRIMEGR